MSEVDTHFERSWAGWICAAVVMVLFGLQQFFPFQDAWVLRGNDSGGLNVLRSLTALLVHSDWLHAAGNALAFVVLLGGGTRREGRTALFAGVPAGAVAGFLYAGWLLPESSFLLGCSGVLYAALGVLVATAPRSRWGLSRRVSLPLFVLAPTLLVLDVALSLLFFDRVAWSVHVLAFVLGFAFLWVGAICPKPWKPIGIS